MRVIARADVDALVDWEAMLGAMRRAFTEPVSEPVRHHHVIERAGASDSTLLLMPAWNDGGDGRSAYAGVKIVTVAPDNAGRDLPSVVGTYLLMDGVTGVPLAAIDGQALTLWRTAAASALAASYLARKDAARHLLIGAGALAPFLAGAMRAVRPIAETLIWNRSLAKAEAAAAELARAGFAARPVEDRAAAIADADIVSAATLSRTPLIEGAWLRPGTHVDLVGAFSPAMRESDDAAVRRAKVFVDTRGGALAEAGDIVQAIGSGAIAAADIRGELSELVRGTVPGRESPGEVTLFKSVGAAREDLYAAVLVYERALAKDLVDAGG